jgi:3-oxoacyl-[acyl-carrier-protein] synthase III
MGCVIKASSVDFNTDTSGDQIAAQQGAIDYSVRASEECIQRAGVDREDIDLVINIGTYREKNINEPSIASLIQKKLKIGLDPFKDLSRKSCFSFDLRNGVVGMLSAVQVADALLKQKMVKLALIVSSDVHPSQNRVPEFPYTHLGAAMLLSWSEDENKGFQRVMFNTSGGDYHGVDASIDLSDPKARKKVDINIQKDFGKRLGDYTIKMFNEYVQSGDLDPNKIDTAIISEPVPGFSNSIANAVGLNGRVLDDIYEKYGNVLSSALPLGYHRAAEKQLFKENDTILFLGAGSGLTFACSLYQV